MIGKAATWQTLLAQRHGSLFIGREREQELFRLNFLYQVPAYLIFALHGPDGVGKSTLLAQYCTSAHEHNAVTVRVDETQATAVREQTILQTMLRMAQQFSAAGTPFIAFEERYEEYTACTRIVAEDFNTPSGGFDLFGDIAEMRERRPEAWDKYLFERFGNPTKIALVKTPVETLTQIFVKDMNTWATVRPIVMGFDDWEHLGPHLQAWLQDLLTRYEMRTNIWLVLAGARPLDETWTAFRPVTATFTLPMFTEDETRAYLSAAGIADPDRVTDIVTFSAGLPALVRLLASADGGRAGDLALTPVDRYLKWLEPPQRRDAVLQCAAARRLDADIIQTATDSADADLTSWLLASPLVTPETDYPRYHPELRRRLLAFAQQQTPALMQTAHTRLHSYYCRRSAGEGGVAAYRDASWRADKLEALYHGLILTDVPTIQEGVEIFFTALRLYYPFAGEIAATWLEATEAQLMANPVTEWGNLLYTVWQALERHDWDAVLALGETCAQHEDISETAQREIHNIRQIVLSRLGRFAPAPEETTPQATTAAVLPVGVEEAPVAETVVPEAELPEGAPKETPVKAAELKHEGGVSLPDLMAEPLPAVEAAAKTTPLPRLQIKEAPLKDNITVPPEAVTPKAGELKVKAVPEAGPAAAAEGEMPAKPQIPEELSVTAAPSAPEVAAIVGETETPAKSAAEATGAAEEPERPSEMPVEAETLPPVAPFPTLASDYHHRATIYLNMGEYDKAIQEFNKALTHDPTYVPAYYDRGLAHARQQHYAEASADFSQVIALNPQHADAYYNRGLVYARQNAFEQALADYDHALALQPHAPVIYNSRGNVHYNTQNYTQAIADYDQAIQHDPMYADAYLNRGLAHAAIEEYQRAIADYNQAIVLNPESAIAYNYRGQAYARLQQYARALEDYTQALTLDPNYAVAYINRGLCYVRLGQYAQAITEYRQAAIANPQYATAYYNAACAAGLMNNASVACTWLERAIQLNPRYRALAQSDTDFEHVRGNKKFQALLTE